MISGPVYPQTPEGLRELLERHLDEVERGLAVVECDLELESGLAVDLLAVDGSGRPVFIFVADGARDAELPARLLGVRAWLQASGTSLLARFLPWDGLDYGKPARFIAVGTDMRPLILSQLHALRALGVEAYRVSALRARGQMMVGAVPLLGADAPPRGGDSYPTPQVVREPMARTPSVEFLNLMSRLDPDLVVTGDEDSRRLSVSGCLLAELCVRDGSAFVYIPVGAADGATEGGADVPPPVGFELASQADCRDIADRVMRRYVSVARGARAAATPSAEAESAEADDPEPGPMSLDRLRHAVGDSRLSSEEYSILGESGTRED